MNLPVSILGLVNTFIFISFVYGMWYVLFWYFSAFESLVLGNYFWLLNNATLADSFFCTWSSLLELLKSHQALLVSLL